MRRDFKGFEVWTLIAMAGLVVGLVGFLLALWFDLEVALRIWATGFAIAVVAWLSRWLWWRL